MSLSCWLATHTPSPTALLLLETGLNGCHLVCCCSSHTCCVGKLAAQLKLLDQSSQLLLCCLLCEWDVSTSPYLLLCYSSGTHCRVAYISSAALLLLHLLYEWNVSSVISATGLLSAVGLLKWNVLQSGLHLLPLRNKYFGNFKTITKGSSLIDWTCD